LRATQGRSYMSPDVTESIEDEIADLWSKSVD
jgi:hypothetical protein